MPDLLTPFALLAVVLLVAALTSGIVERAPISFPMIFLGLGFLLGAGGLGVLRIGLHDPALETVAVLSLSFVLFLDALNLRLNELRQDWLIPVLALGPGALLTLLFTAGIATALLGLPPVQSFLLGAILASVDPVLLRDVMRDERIPRSVRRTLSVEAGTNDIVVLPVILVLAALVLHQGSDAGTWILLLAKIFVLGPLVGVAVGAVGTRLMTFARTHTDVRREYRALYGVGTLLAAYVAGEAVGGSGFLAVFAAGLTIVVLDYDLCDCFLEYGEITSEMTMLLVFLLFGALLSTLIALAPLGPSLIFAALVLLVVRPTALNLALWRASISLRARAFIGWFGPRGLSSLLFGLLLVGEGVPESERLLAISGVVVIISVVAHGLSAAPLANRYGRAVARETLAEEREGTAAGLFQPDAGEVPRITPAELEDRLRGVHPPLVLDVRSRSAYEHEGPGIPGSVRVPPDQVEKWAADQPREQAIVAYCT